MDKTPRFSSEKKENILSVLSSYYWAQMQVAEDEACLENLRDAAAGGKAVDYSKVTVHGGVPQTMGDKVVYLVQFEKQVKVNLMKRQAAMERVLKIIDGVQDERLRMLLTQRYREFKSWSKIGKTMHYSWRHTMRIHKLALRAADKAWKELEKKITND